MTNWSPRIYLICLGFLQLSTLLLHSFSRLLSVMGCPAHLSPFILAHTKLAAHEFFKLVCIFAFLNSARVIN